MFGTSADIIVNNDATLYCFQFSNYDGKEIEKTDSVVLIVLWKKSLNKISNGCIAILICRFIKHFFELYLFINWNKFEKDDRQKRLGYKSFINIITGLTGIYIHID